MENETNTALIRFVALQDGLISRGPYRVGCVYRVPEDIAVALTRGAYPAERVAATYSGEITACDQRHYEHFADLRAVVKPFESAASADIDAHDSEKSTKPPLRRKE